MHRFSRPVVVGDVTSQPVIKLLGLRMSHKMSFMPQAQKVNSGINARFWKITVHKLDQGS